MSGLSEQLHPGGDSAGGCGGPLADDQGCAGGLAGLEGLEGPGVWSGELGVQELPPEPPNDGAPLVTYDPFLPASSSALANGLHLHRTLGLVTRRRRQPETRAHPETQTLEGSLRDMQTHVDPGGDSQGGLLAVHMDGHVHGDADVHKGSMGSEQATTLSPETARSASPLPPPLPPVNHPAPTNQTAPPILTAETDLTSPYCPAPIGPNPPPGPSSLPIEAERKYALRSSGRPRFPCHLRKSSRLRRSTEDVERRGGREKGGQEEEELAEEKIWKLKEEEVTVAEKERPTVEPALPAATFPIDLPLALTVPKPVPKIIPKLGAKPGPKPGPKSGPKSGHKPGPKSRSVQRAGPKSVTRTGPRPAISTSTLNRSAPLLGFPLLSTNSIPPLAVKREEPDNIPGSLPNGRRRGRFVGVRKIVVKVARIPVNLSRRQKSYKISNMETVTGPEKVGEGGLEGSDAVREPTALLRMKNNGKSVMVMFPPGELPVILKRRRGRPPKQALPGIQGEPLNVELPGATTEQVKKPRRRRRTKLPSPHPSYVNDTNDVKADYGDVLSKLAFLNQQPLATGRCSPPRCWTPSEPESFHTPSENPGISTLLHKLTGFRRRGGRGGGIGSRGGGMAGSLVGGEGSKSTFSDFFESIGKKRKLSPPSAPGLPKKRGKGAGGVGRGGGIVGSEAGGEKVVKKRRPRKNGVMKEEDRMFAGQDWDGARRWGEDGGMEREKGLGGYQSCGSPRGSFPSCEMGKGGAYCGPGGGRGAGPPGEDSQGLFAGYFRSLLDSDDSSDLLDISSPRGDHRKTPSTPGYEPSSPAPGASWSPAFSKRSPKGPGSGVEGPSSSQCSSTRPPYSYGSLAQTSPTTSTYPKSTPPSLSLSRSPSSPHPSSYGHYQPGYSSSSPAGGSVGAQRSSDCSFSYGSGHSGKATPIGQGQMGYSGYQPTAKRGYSGYPGAAHSSIGRGESVGPMSPGAGYMAMAKNSPFSSSSSPEAYRNYPSHQWGYRQGYGGWAGDGFGSQYHGYSEYGSNESKDILDISNYTPQKAKRPPFPESLSESSSDSSHLGPVAIGCGSGSGGGPYKQKEPPPIGGEGSQSSLSSLEKLMMDWHESAAGPSYNWSQNVLFQGGGTGKQGRGRRKRAELHGDKEGGSALVGSGPPDSPSTPPATPTPKRGGGSGRPRGSRGGRGGLSPCQRERPVGTKAKAKAASASVSSVGTGTSGGPGGSVLFQEGLDYYSGDSSSLSPMSTTNPAPPTSYTQDTCEYPSPYSAHPSTPSSEERYPAIFPGESSSSLSPNVSSPPYPPKPTPPPPQTYHPVPSRTFSPSCPPSPRIPPHCGTAMSPSHRPPAKDPQYPQYDSPSYCSSPYWYGQASHSGSPSPHPQHTTHSNTPTPTHANTHSSPHGNAHANPLGSPHANTHALAGLTPHGHNAHHANAQPPHPNLSPHANPSAHSHLHASTHSHSSPHSTNHPHALTPHHSTQGNPNPNPGAHLHSHPNPSPGLHTHVYEERSPPAVMPAHKRDVASHHMGAAHRQAATLPSSPYAKTSLDSSPHPEDLGGYPLPHHSFPGMGHRYPPQSGRGGGVLCQLLEPASEDSFSVTSL